MPNNDIILIIALIANIGSAVYIYHKAHKIGYREGVQKTVDNRVGEDLADSMKRIADGVDEENAIKKNRLALETAKVKQEWVRLQLEEKKLQTLKDLEGEKKD